MFQGRHAEFDGVEPMSGCGKAPLGRVGLREEGESKRGEELPRQTRQLPIVVATGLEMNRPIQPVATLWLQESQRLSGKREIRGIIAQKAN